MYDRSEESAYGVYAYEADVDIRVAVKDRNGIWMPQASFNFQIESETEHDQAQFYQPESILVDSEDPVLMGAHNAGIYVNSGDLDGAKILYSSQEPVTPRFGPEGELPELIVEGEQNVGIPLNLEPPTVFNLPVRIFVPCPGFIDVSRIKLYLHNGSGWVPALDENGNVLSGGIDCIVPGTRVNHNNGNPSAIEIQLYHFSGLQAVSTGGDEDLLVSSSTQIATGGGGGGGGGGGCFIGTLFD